MANTGMQDGFSKDRAKSMADDLGETAENAVNSVNDAVREGVGAARGYASQAAETAAETIESTAKYFREGRGREMADEVYDYVKTHPFQALAGAAVIGFLAGRLVGRD